MAEDKSSIRRTAISLADKRDLMWNFTEPGDPYDIRKSMIARLPGEQKFMGPHLELVCLLQAAEIERLCQFLDEFKMKFRENERVELDRHSYEIQIRELTQRLNEEQNYRAEIEKLRQFIRRQSVFSKIQLEELQNYKHSGELQRNYEESLRQIAELKQVNSKLVAELRSAREQHEAGEQSKIRELQTVRGELIQKNTSFTQLQGKWREGTSRWQAERKQLELRLSDAEEQKREIQEHNNELETENRTLKREIERLTIETAKTLQLSHTIGEYQHRFQILAEEIDRLNGVLRQKSRELTEEYARSRQLGQLNRQQAEELSQSEVKVRELEQNNSRLQRQHRETLASLSSLEQTKSLTQSYQASLQKLSIEVDRLNNVLRKKLNELEEARRRNNEAEIRLKTLESLEKENNDYKIRQAEVNKRIANYEKEVAQGKQQNERLNYSIKKLIEELNSLELRLKSAQKEIENRQKTIDILSAQIGKERDNSQTISAQLAAALADSDSLRSALARSEESRRVNDSKLSQYATQIKRLEYSISQKEEEASNIRQSRSETELRIRQVESINQNDQLYIEELLGKNKDLDQKLSRVVEENQQLKVTLQTLRERPTADMSNVVMQQSQQISRLNDLLANRDNDIRKLSAVNDQLKSSVDLAERQQKSQPDVKHLQELLHSKGSQLSTLQQRFNKLQIGLIQKEEAMQYYVGENERYYAENERLKNNLEEREERIERLENEIDRINRIVTQHPEATAQEVSDEHLRLEVEHGVLQERFTLLNEENEANVRKLHDLQEEMIKLQYQLTEALRTASHRSEVKQQPSSEKKQVLVPSKSGDSLEVYDREHLRQLQYLRDRCAYLTQESERSRESGLRQEQEVSRLHQQLAQTQRTLAQGVAWLQFKPIQPAQHVENYQTEYLDILQRYNRLTLTHEQIRLEVKQLKQQLTAKQSQSGATESSQMKRKNQQITQYYNKILIFSEEINRLNSVLATRQKEKEGLINEFKQRAEAYQANIRQLTSSEGRDPRFSLFSEERQRLTEQGQRLSGKNSKLEQDLRELKAEGEKQKRLAEDKLELLQKEILRLNSILQQKVDECKLLEEKGKALVKDLEEERRTPKKDVIEEKKGYSLNEYQTKIALLGQEIERLNGVLKTKIENYQILQEQYHRYQADAYTRINQHTQENHEAQSEIFKLRSELAELKSNDQLKSLQIQSLPEYQAKILELSNQIQRLNRLLYSSKQRTDEFEQKENKYRTQIERLNNSLRLKVEESLLTESRERGFQNERDTYQRQIQAKNRQYEALSAKYRQIDEENYINKQHLVEYEKRIKVLYEEFERLQKIITALKKENEEKSTAYANDLIEKNRFLGTQIERLSKINRKQGEQLSELRISLVEDNSLQRRINEDLALFVVLFSQIQALRERVRQQEQEIEEVRQQNIAARLV